MPHKVNRLLSLPYTFVAMNWAAVAGLFYLITGKRDLWLKNKSSHAHKK